MKSVIDTSTLISLARINFLELIPMLRKDVALPVEIYEEAVRKGEEKGFADATVIKQFIEEHGINILPVKTRSVAAVRKRISKILAKGDEAVLSLAFQERASEIVCDDDGLGKIAMALAFKVTATPDLLREALRRKALRLESYEIAMRGLVIENRLISAIAELYIVEGRKDVEG